LQAAHGFSLAAHSYAALSTPPPAMFCHPSQPPAFVPCSLLGALVGATAVYTYEQGDISAVRRKLLPSVKRHVRSGVAAAARLLNLQWAWAGHLNSWCRSAARGCTPSALCALLSACTHITPPHSKPITRPIMTLAVRISKHAAVSAPRLVKSARAVASAMITPIHPIDPTFLNAL
jgi:hypothetical protein